jgi:hypothetical protein
MSYAAPVSIAAATIDAARQARVARRLSPSPFLAEPLRALGYDSRELSQVVSQFESIVKTPLE